jgi:Protein of unknown function (DUF3499)
MARRCARPTCSAEATVTLSYGYAERNVWLDRLTAVDDPANHDLCEGHADRVTAPQGWVLHDRRAPAAPIWQARAS